MYALTASGMRTMDQYTIERGIPSPVLMENASRGVVEAVCEKFPSPASTEVLVLAGPGNNGGDALCVSRWLLHLGYGVCTYFVGDVDHTSEEWIRQRGILREMYPDHPVAGLDEDGKDLAVLKADYDIIIDGMFGTGLNRRFGLNFVRFIEYINAKKAYKVAIDVPSGLNATTGQIMEAVFQADLTVTFANYKTGMFFGSGREVCGEIRVIDIGLMKSGYNTIRDKILICDQEFLDSTREMALVARRENSHKGTFGTVGIVVGNDSMMGAGMLAAKAAYRTGCGLVRIFCPSKYTGFFNVSIPEAVVVPYKNEEVLGALDEFLATVDVVLIGPGLREDQTGRLMVKEVLSQTTPAVLDAGALNLIARNLKSFRKRRCKCVITPHLGEMARLCGEDLATVDKNRIGFTRRFSEKFNVSMVVKSDISLVSLIGTNGTQKLYLNLLGNSGLATAGSGDVLAGMIASLAAQGNTLNNSLLYGVMFHGRAAERFAPDEDSRRRMMAGDIIDHLF